MVELLRVLRDGLRYRREAVAMSDDRGTVTGHDLSARVAGLAEDFSAIPPVVGLLGANGTDWALAALAAWMAGKTVVPMPTFFSRLQLEHVLRDASISHVIATDNALTTAAALGVGVTLISEHRAGTHRDHAPGAGMIVYTSGSTGRPKGVRLRIEQIDWQARALADAIGATPNDVNLSLLPLALLLETITAVCVPVLIGARTHFASAVAENIGTGRPADLLAAFEAVRPTTAVLVPQLLSGLVAQLEMRKARAHESLRFVAVGGARVSEALTTRAWELGIPVHEGYGLTECCSVVAVNRPERRKAGTAGEPLKGLDVRIDDGEIVVSGPTIMDGYLHGPRVEARWRTGDLGHCDENGFLSVTGRKDNLIVTANGRNISPEWIEAMVASDPRVADCVLLGHGMSHPSLLLVPSQQGEEWLMESPRAHIQLWLEQICAEAPAYAVPKDFVVCPGAQANRVGLITSNGRIVREAALGLHPALKRRPSPHEPKAEIPQTMEGQVSFYDRLIAETERERIGFISIPLISEAVRSGASRELYLDFLTQAYHHVKHTFSLLAFAAARTKDEAYQNALVEYMEEERGHEKWILNDIIAMGGNAAAVRDGMPGIACQVMVGYTYYAIEWISPYAMLGSVHVLEGMSTLLADKAADGIQRSLGASVKEGFSYLRSHGALDIEHVAFFKQLVNGISDSKTQLIVIDASKVFYRLYGDIYRELATRHPVKSHAA
jgi:long-chain acyl-CoA synthetase